MDTDPQVQEWLDKAADYIEEHGWLQRSYGGYGKPACLVGALRTITWDMTNFQNIPEWEEVKPAVCDELSRRIGVSAYTIWNDHPHRTKAQVVGMLRGKDWKEL